jgi:hypothetical protein
LKGHIPEKKWSAGNSLNKKLLRAAISKKSPQNKLNLIKIYNFVIFEMFTGRTNASGGPHAARVFENPGIDRQNEP